MKKYLKITDKYDNDITYIKTEKINHISKWYDSYMKHEYLNISLDSGSKLKFLTNHIEVEEVDNMEIKSLLNIEEE